MGVKDLAVTSDRKVYINKKKAVKKLKKKLKRIQKQVSRKYEKYREVNNRYDKSQNIVKLENKIRLVRRRISNIRNNNFHQITNEIVKTKPSRIVMEDLKLSDRVFKCECGHVMNRDLNASINLSNYRVS